jgi:hypothetical protein
MKKSVLVFAAVLVLAVFVAAPASAQSKFSFGLKAGASSSNVKWTDDVGDESSIIEPTFGGFAILNLSPNMGLQFELDYLVTGETWPSETYGTVKEKFGYLHIPVLFRYKFMTEGKFIPIVFAGPAFGFLLSANETGYGDVKEFFKPTDFGLDMGLGAEIALGKMKALIDARYYLGLGNAYNDPGQTMKNSAFLLTAGIIF